MRKVGPYQNLLLSVMAFHVTPLLPVLIELSLTDAISDRSLTLTVAIYSATMLTCSRVPGLISFYILISIFQCVLFGALTSNDFVLGASRIATFACLAFILVSQLAERYVLHVVEERQFWA